MLYQIERSMLATLNVRMSPLSLLGNRFQNGDTLAVMRQDNNSMQKERNVLKLS
jgi:hypothetical protein